MSSRTLVGVRLASLSLAVAIFIAITVSYGSGGRFATGAAIGAAVGASFLAPYIVVHAASYVVGRLLSFADSVWVCTWLALEAGLGLIWPYAFLGSLVWTAGIIVAVAGAVALFLVTICRRDSRVADR